LFSNLFFITFSPPNLFFIHEQKQKKIGTSVEYDGSPRRFGMVSNDDVDYYTTSQSSYKYGGPLNSPPPPAPSNGTLINYSSSSSPPRPGFPQRILSHSASTSAANAIQIPKSYSFDDHQSLLTSSSYGSQQQPQQNVTTTSTLIPTTFIKNSMSAYELLVTQEKTQQATIVEEESEIVVDPQDDEELGGSANMIMVLPEATIATCSMNNTITVTNTAIADDCVEDNYDEDKSQMHTDASNIINNTASNTFDITSPTENLPISTFDYLYEFSETRKVLEEFFKCPDDKIKEFEKFSDFNESDDSLVSFSFLSFIPFTVLYNFMSFL